MRVVERSEADSPSMLTILSPGLSPDAVAGDDCGDTFTTRGHPTHAG